MSDKINYAPRNTSLDLEGRVRVRGQIVCSPRGEHVRPGSFYTPKGTQPVTDHSVNPVDLSAFTSQDD